MLCIELRKEYMTPREIASAYNETVTVDDDHWIEVMAQIHEHSSLEEVANEMYNIRQERK